MEARKLKNAVICKQQQAQLAEFRENYLERLRIEKRDGELIQKKVARNLKEDVRAREERPSSSSSNAMKINSRTRSSRN